MLPETAALPSSQWKAFANEQLVKQPNARVCFAAGKVRLASEGEPGLNTPNVRNLFCEALVAEILAGAGAPPKSIAEQSELLSAADEFAALLAFRFVHEHGEHITVKHLLTIIRQVSEVRGKPPQELRRSCRTIRDALRSALPDHPQRSLDATSTGTAARSNSVCMSFLMGVVAGLTDEALCPDQPQVFKRVEAADVSALALRWANGITGIVGSQESARVFQAVHSNPALSQTMLEQVLWLLDTYGRACGPTEALTIETAAAGMILRLSPHTLTELALDIQAIDWLSKRACMLLGYIASLKEGFVSLRSCKASVDAGAELELEYAKQLARLGDEYVRSPDGSAMSAHLLAALPMLREIAAQRTHLAQIEARLQEAYPDERVSFLGEDVNELLEWFPPPQPLLSGSNGPSLRLEHGRSLSAATPGSIVVGPTPGSPGEAAMHDAALRQGSGDEDFSLPHFLAQCRAFEQAKLEKARAAQQVAAGALASEVPVTGAESKAPGGTGTPNTTQSHEGGKVGSKRFPGYNHRHPANKNVPAPVRDARRSRLVDMIRHGRKFTEGDRVHFRRTKHKPRADIKDVD